MTDIFILGEAWGAEEAEARAPFVGASGRLLNSLLYTVGIDRSACYVSNVFNLQPKPKNDIKNLCGPERDRVPGFPALMRGKWIRKEFLPELERLDRELQTVNPKLVIALGGTASWFMFGTPGIRGVRGAATIGRHGLKTLATYHPAAVMRQWSLRPIVLSDLDKARGESTFREVRRPRREVWVEPSPHDLIDFRRQFIDPSPDLAVDIENAGEIITCIGFAPSPSVALVVPFFDPRRGHGSYWDSADLEEWVWQWVREVLSLKKRIIFQNGAYDMHHLWRTQGIPVPYASDDTMLLHHALYPEMEKGLGFLGSIYTGEASWKLNHKRSTIKKED